MIDRYLTYLSSVRRYSPRTVEIYHGVLEDFYSFATSDTALAVASPEPTSEAEAAAASGNRATLGIVRGGTASEAKRWGPKDVSGGWLPGRRISKGS